MAVNVTAFSQSWDINPKFAAVVSTLIGGRYARIPSPADT
jgi:hypothetical protein